VLPNCEGDRRKVRHLGSKSHPLLAANKLGVDLVCERLAATLVQVMEDTFNRRALSLRTSRGAELEHHDCTALGVEDKEIVWIAAIRDG
jgi:hypothetical protein